MKVKIGLKKFGGMKKLGAGKKLGKKFGGKKMGKGMNKMKGEVSFQNTNPHFL